MQIQISNFKSRQLVFRSIEVVAPISLIHVLRTLTTVNRAMFTRYINQASSDSFHKQGFRSRIQFESNSIRPRYRQLAR